MAAALRRAGFRKGVLGGNRALLVVWMVLTALRVLRKMGGKGEEKVVFREELKPGDRLLISHDPES